MHRLTTLLLTAMIFAGCSARLLAAAAAVSPALPNSSAMLQHFQAASLLSSDGKLASVASAKTIDALRRHLAQSDLLPDETAQKQIEIGELLLVVEKQPQKAVIEFDDARQQIGVDKSLVSLAEYDTVVADFNYGAYDVAKDQFPALDTPKTALPGYDRRACALWLRHTGACAGYHQQHAYFGIHEPLFLDSYCGVAALATSVRTLDVPYGIETVAAKYHITGI